MKTEESQGTDPPGQDGEAPVVNLAQVRQQRSQRLKEVEAAQAERRRRLFRLEQELQLKVLHHVMRTGRMLFSDFADLIRLGIVTDDESHLPCQVHARDTNHYSWESAAYGEEADDPDEDLIDGLVEQLRQAGLNDDGAELRSIIDSRKHHVPPANKVVCPLLSYGEDEDPPCAFALQNRFTSRFEDGEHRRYQILPDPEDPVLKSKLHPCAFLGKEMFRLVMPGVWLPEQQDATLPKRKARPPGTGNKPERKDEKPETRSQPPAEAPEGE